MTSELKEWLYTPCLPSDLLELEKNVWYMPIGVVKQKIQYMEDNFGVLYLETGFNHLYFSNGQKEAIASGSISITLMQTIHLPVREELHVSKNEYPQQQLIAQLIGTATFPLSYYGVNTHYAATLESLCIVNAFGGKYPQFGSALNKLDVVSPAAKITVPSAVNTIDKVEEKLFNNLKKKLSKYLNREDAQAYLDTMPEYRMNLELKEIVKNKPTKY